MRVRSYLAAVLTSVAVNTHAKTQTLNLKNLQAEGVSSIEEPKRSTPAQVYGQIRMEGMQYLTPIPETPNLTYSQLLSARLSALKETSWVDMVADISGGTFFSRGQSHFVVHEAYIANHGNTPLKVYAGRKKNGWSEMDRRWQMGLWQPKFAIDTLRPDEQGLTGLFADYNMRGWEVVAFATPVFIPSMGPDIREEGGGLVADSRWYRAPSRDFALNNRVNKIVYELDIPETAKLVGNGAVAMMGRLGSKDRGPWVVASAGHLPVNELILKRKIQMDASEGGVDVTVSPDLTYHDLYSVDMGYAFENVKTSVSYLQDEPTEKRPDADWAIQKLMPLKAYSAAIDFSLNNILTRTLAFQLEYLKVEGGGIVDIRSDGKPDDFTLFDARLKFTNALSFRVEGQLASIFRRPFVTRFKYLYDYDQRGSLLNTEFLYYPNQKWAVVLGGDVLGVQDENHNPSSFLNQYRANDRVYGGMTYVF
ncbi:transposase [Bdellovibrio sp. HCB117]|uniref:transposase n=1 Tax=Bdellovibrio TaxID=958 RepID=UPI000AD1EA74|nr:transposase [Bdellovibrio bacteriovorus]